MGSLKRQASHLRADSNWYSFRIDGLQNKYDSLQPVMDESQGKISALEKAKSDLQREVKELSDEVKEMHDEIKKLRDGISRKRKTDATDGIEEAPTLKRRRVKIREYDNRICIVLS